MIKADNISVSFKKGVFKEKIKALDCLSLSVEEGDVFALLGPNGAGKSTAMYCFLGLIQPDKGSVTVMGSRPCPGSQIFGDIAYLPEEPHYHLYLTVEEAVGYYASLYGKRISGNKVREAIERVGLSEYKDLRLQQCSKGMKQKAGIAQCLVGNPKLIFLDEPTRGLDPVMVKEFRDILKELNKTGSTIILNSHILSEIEMICDRIAIISKGRVIATDELNKLRNYDSNAYQVDIDLTEHRPAYLDVKTLTSDRIRGEIPSTRLGEFIQFATSSNIRIYECSLKKNSLEEIFFSVLKGDG